MSNKNWQNIHKIKLKWSRLQKQVPFSEEMNKLGYIITQLDLQHSAGWVGGTEKGAAEQNSKNKVQWRNCSKKHPWHLTDISITPLISE